jgi:hypothetical protein
MTLKHLIVFIILFAISSSGIGQESFYISENLKKSTISFELVNNLMVIPVHVNGEKLLFLLDTGIDRTILFNLSTTNSISLLGVEKIKIRGLGEGKEIEALKSMNNTLRIDNIVGKNQIIYVILKAQFDLSPKMGMDINGIIGGDLIEDFIVKVNYSSKKITFYEPEYYEYKKCKGCMTFPIEFYKRKPLLKVAVETHLEENFEVKLLIDSGGSDALWLFEDSHQNIKIPEDHFIDLLGQGLGGDIYGKRSIIKKMEIGKFGFENVSVSYPDSTSIVSIQNNRERNGTIGSEILRRFHIIYDYKNKKITLKKNASNYNDIFTFNKSGIELVYGGEMLVSEQKRYFNESKANVQSQNTFSDILYSYNLAYKRSYQISFLRDGSPAKKVGLKVGDIILEINGKTAYNYFMEEIIYILSGRVGKKIRLLVDRDGKHVRYFFELQKLL